MKKKIGRIVLKIFDWIYRPLKDNPDDRIVVLITDTKGIVFWTKNESGKWP